eukprot:618266-Hanusia_phi.AAC.1
MRNSYNISNSERVRVIDSPVKNPSPSTIVTEKSSGAEGTGVTCKLTSVAAGARSLAGAPWPAWRVGCATLESQPGGCESQGRCSTACLRYPTLWRHQERNICLERFGGGNSDGQETADQTCRTRSGTQIALLPLTESAEASRTFVAGSLA